MKSKLKWITIGITSVLVSIVVFSFDSTCACVSPLVDFAEFLNVPPIGINQDSITSGLAKKYPKGSKMTLDGLLFLGEKRELTSKGDLLLFECWLESNPVAQRGYLITFELSDTKIEGIKVNSISSWFGHQSIGKETVASM